MNRQLHANYKPNITERHELGAFFHPLFKSLKTLLTADEISQVRVLSHRIYHIRKRLYVRMYLSHPLGPCQRKQIWRRARGCYPEAARAARGTRFPVAVSLEMSED